jgi:uncharacterized protein (DUF2249 family)/hemerythrin-like domain-containing protein
MSEITEAIYNHHRQIGNTLHEYVARIVEGSADADPNRLVDFLKTELVPHAVGEERYLYPAVDPLVKSHGSATATMTVDHEFITGYINRIEEVVRSLSAAGTSEATSEEVRNRRAELQRLCLQLEALLMVHMEKEERVYLPLFEKYLSEEERKRVLDGMHEDPAQKSAHAGGAAPDQVLDVREIPPRNRHGLIFDTFDALVPGSAFVLVNDHDPKPLYYQLSVERGGLFTWDYIEQGPETWRVRIARVTGTS